MLSFTMLLTSCPVLLLQIFLSMKRCPKADKENLKMSMFVFPPAVMSFLVVRNSR